MKFRTSDLVARIEDQIQQLEEADERSHQEAIEKYEKDRAEWLLLRGKAWVEFADKVKDKIRKDRPIMTSDMPKALTGRRWRDQPDFFDQQRPTKKRTDPKRMNTLRSALLAVEDEYVTTTGLREIGFKNVANLFTGGDW